MNPIIELINKRSLKKSIPDIATGDIVRVSQKIREGAKTRTQVFEGIVISREGGNGITAAITVRKIASGVGVEKKFLLNSPNVEEVKVLRSSKVRRKKIFFLRGLTGKAAKMKEKQRKVMEEIGLKEDEVENAETTQELAQPEAEETQEVVAENKDEAVVEEKVEEAKEEPVAEEAKEEKAEEAVEVPAEVPAQEEAAKEEPASEDVQASTEEEIKDEEPKE